MRKDERERLKIIFIVYLIIVFIIFELFIIRCHREYNSKEKGKPIAKLNNTKFYEDDIKYQIFLVSQQNNGNLVNYSDYTKINLDEVGKGEIISAIINKYISDTIIQLFKKKKLKLSNDSKFLVDNYRNELIMNEYINDFIFANINDKKIEEKYNQLLEEFSRKETRDISHILFEDEQDAMRSYNLIKANRQSFEKEAMTKSIDKATAIKGGNIGYVLKEELKDRDLANLIFLLKVGEISKPLKTKDGWEIIKINNSKKMEIKTLEDSRKEIEALLKESEYDLFLKTLNIDELENKIIFYKDFKENIVDENNSFIYKETIDDNNINYENE